MIPIFRSEDYQQKVVTKRDEQKRRVQNAEQQWAEGAHLDQVQEHLPKECVHVGYYAAKGPQFAHWARRSASIAHSGKKYRQPATSTAHPHGLAFGLRWELS